MQWAKTMQSYKTFPDIEGENKPGSQLILGNTWFGSDTAVQAERDLIMIAEKEIHVWRAYLDREGVEINLLYQYLSRDEKIRADQFHFRSDRMRFIARRGWQRIILSRYLDLEPDRIQYKYNEYGKPELDFLPGDKEICFNTTHSSHIALYAITKDRDVGIDVERVVHGYPCEGISGSFFSNSENEQLLEIDQGESRETAFFSCWTRKEAYIKAHGKGLSIPLHQFDVSMNAGEPARVIEDRHKPYQASPLSMVDIPASPGFVAAVAYEGNDCRVLMRDI
jgi:4'-phosphopantetheinyl transferase